jgi:cytochrome c-type biogenesis protein CcmH/NrfF
MAEINWRFPMRCPKCQADDGRAWRVESKTAAEVTVRLRCGKCAHEWEAERQTPLLIPPPPGKMPPENQA